MRRATDTGSTPGRRYSRYVLDTRVTLRVFRNDGVHVLWGRSADLSENGIAATISGELFEGEVVTLSFSLDPGAAPLEMRASVRFRRGFFCGFEFLILTDEQRAQIKRACGFLVAASSGS